MFVKFSPRELLAMLDPETQEAFRKELHNALLSEMKTERVAVEVEKKIERTVAATIEKFFEVKESWGKRTLAGEAAVALDNALRDALNGVNIQTYLKLLVRDEVREYAGEIIKEYIEKDYFMDQFKASVERWRDEDIQVLVQQEVKKTMAQMYHAIPNPNPKEVK